MVQARCERGVTVDPPGQVIIVAIQRDLRSGGYRYRYVQCLYWHNWVRQALSMVHTQQARMALLTMTSAAWRATLYQFLQRECVHSRLHRLYHRIRQTA